VSPSCPDRWIVRHCLCDSTMWVYPRVGGMLGGLLNVIPVIAVLLGIYLEARTWSLLGFARWAPDRRRFLRFCHVLPRPPGGADDGCNPWHLNGGRGPMWPFSLASGRGKAWSALI